MDQRRFVLSSNGKNDQFKIEIDSNRFQCCKIITNLLEHTADNSDILKNSGNMKLPNIVDTPFTKSHLKKFVELHDRFSNPDIDSKNNISINNLFGKMSEEDFRDFTWHADFMQCTRFVQVAGDFMLKKMKNMDDVEKIRRYIGVVDDYTEEEKQYMKDNPLKFYYGITVDKESEKPTTK